MPTTDKAAMKQRVFEQAEAAHVRFVSLQFTDIMGVVKNVHIPFHKFGDAVENGLWFDGSSIEGFARIHESDMFLDPDLETARSGAKQTDRQSGMQARCIRTERPEAFADRRARDGSHADPDEILRSLSGRGRRKHKTTRN